MQVNDYYGDSVKFLVGICEEVIDEVFIRVRVFGVHPIDKEAVTTEMLPPAQVIYPVTGDQVSSGSITHNIQVDSWVVGYWLDWPYCQRLIVTGVIQGTDYSMSTYESQGGEFVGEGSGGESGTSNDPVVGNTGETMNIPGDSNVQKVYNYVTSKLQAEGFNGNTHIQTSALIGVLMVESTPSINPQIVNPSGGAYGIAQWLTPSRRRPLFAKYGRNPTLSQQLDYMWWELNNTERPAKGRWLRATNLEDATAGFASYERAEEFTNGKLNRNHRNFRLRLKYAYQVYNSMKQTGNATFTQPIVTTAANTIVGGV